MRGPLALAAWVLTLPLVVLWPLPRVWSTELLAVPDQEALPHLWGLWAAGATGQGLRLQTPLMRWPDGVELVLVDPLHAAPYAVGSALAGPVAGYNTVLYFGVALMAAAGAALARQAGGHAWIGALVAALSPTLIANAADGQTEGFGVGWVGLHTAAMLAARAGSAPAVAAAAATLGAAAWAGPYNAVWALLIDAALLGGALLGRDGPGLRRLAAGLAGGGAALAPVAWTVLHARADALPGGAARAGLPERIPAPDIFRGGIRTGADLLDPWVPGPWTGGEASPSHTAYLGLFALLIAGAGAARDPRARPFLAGAIGFAALSLGPWLYLRGIPMSSSDGAPIAGPAGLLMLGLPPLARLTRWYRAGAVASLLLAPVVARAAAGRRAGFAVVVGVGVAIDCLWAAPLTWPLAHAAPPAGAWAAIRGGGPLLELPPATTGQPPPGAWRDAGAFAQVIHGRPVAGSFMSLGVSPDGQRALLQLREALREGRVTAGLHADLRQAGFTGILVHRTHLPFPASSAAALAGCLGRVVLDGPAAWALELSPAPGPGCAPTAD